jgi:hypothetical protein
MKHLIHFFLLSMFCLCSIPTLSETNVKQNKAYVLKYDSPAPDNNIGWEDLSLPLGNGYFGVNVFGGIEKERLQLSEKSMFGRDTTQTDPTRRISFTNFAEIYLDFPFKSSNVLNYSRELNISKSIATISFSIDNVRYKREVFTSYPDNVLVIKLSASKSKMISFTLRPEHVFLGQARSGEVMANNDKITLSGVLEPYKVKFEAQMRVKNFGGDAKCENKSQQYASISVENADSAVIIMSLGTNYILSPQVIMGGNYNNEKNAEKLKGRPSPHSFVSNTIDKAFKKTYTTLLKNHTEDYCKLFDRVYLNLEDIVPTITTDKLLVEYKSTGKNKYLDELYFQYGRYLLISMSRPGTLPANLQGTWNVHRVAPWTGGYWMNINLQMNYWPAFNTNLAETFTPYLDYIEALIPSQERTANDNVKKYNFPAYNPVIGSCGWTAGTGNSPYSGSGPGGTSGFGTGPFISQNIWEYYQFTKDKKILKSIWPILKGSSDFTSRIVKKIDGYNNLLLCSPSWSPENQYTSGELEKKYIDLPGTAYDQQLIYQGHLNTINAAKILGGHDSIIQSLTSQLQYLDPVQIGETGQIKEFRQEKAYGEFGEKQHRHISQLIGLYPCSLINDNTPEWLNAAKITLSNRGDRGTGWSLAHKINFWARIKDGDHTYLLLQNLLKFNTKNNLWDTHPPFQIDGNMGAIAGIAEMLLQSHEGYIALLPAIPTAWQNGEYKGLVARGNFEVSVSWSNGVATKIEILSRSGEECNFKYPSFANPKIVDSKAKEIPYTVNKNNIVSFKTEKGINYIISNSTLIK